MYSIYIPCLVHALVDARFKNQKLLPAQIRVKIAHELKT